MEFINNVERLRELQYTIICNTIGGHNSHNLSTVLTLFQLGRDNFYPHNSVSRDKA
jgi:hypothetical protein